MSVIEAAAPEIRNVHDKFHDLMEASKKLAPIKVAVAHPCDQSSLQAVVEAAERNLIEPILVGPKARIEEVAKTHDLDISGFEIVEAGFSQDSAARAVELVREGRAEALMKGSLHTD